MRVDGGSQSFSRRDRGDRCVPALEREAERRDRERQGCNGHPEKLELTRE